MNLKSAGAQNAHRLIFEQTKKPQAIKDLRFFGDPERTRTVDLQRDRLAC